MSRDCRATSLFSCIRARSAARFRSAAASTTGIFAAMSASIEATASSNLSPVKPASISMRSVVALTGIPPPSSDQGRTVRVADRP